MFKFMVSYDCGTTYREEQTAEHIDLLDNRCEELDEQRLRWKVEGKRREIVRVCKIHMDILAFMCNTSMDTIIAIAKLGKEQSNELPV